MIVRLVRCGAATLHVRLWPGDAARSVVIWHGITGTGGDHLVLAERLARAGHQVVAPDSLGCGASDWAVDAKRGYGLGVLRDHAVAMLDALAIDRTAWIGASKGGGLGIRVAGEVSGRVAALVLCDVGPGLPAAFREALATRLANPPAYPDVAAFRAHVARLLARDGTDPDPLLVDRLAIGWARRLGAGQVGYHYDPGLAHQLREQPEDFDLWRPWEAVGCPALVLRGERSTVFSPAEQEEMLRRNPRARAGMLAGAGHMAFLDEPEHGDTIATFLADAP